MTKQIACSLAMVLAVATGATAQITVTAPPAGTTVVGPANDYATRTFQDPWDMSQHSDLGWFTWANDQPLTNLTSRSLSGGIFSGTPTNDDPSFWLLDSFVPGSAELGKVGRAHPIDASTYRMLALRMRLANSPTPDARGPQVMQVLWSNNTIYGSESGGGFRVSNAVPTYGGWNVYVVDLVTLGASSGPAWSGTVDSLRIDPTQYQEAGQIQLDWARLVPRDDAALQRTIQWTGAGSVDIFIDGDNSSANGHLGQIGRSVSGGSFPFYVGALAPGDYYIAMRAAGTSNSLVYSSGIYRVLAAPTVQITSPSEEGSEDDFATVYLNDAWDMDSTSDVDRTTGLTGLSTGTIAGINEAGESLGSVPVLQATSTASAGVGDPAVYWLWSTERGYYHRIDADRYRVLTFELTLPGNRDLVAGSIARVIWKLSDESVENVSQDILINHRSGANVFARVIADMKTLELETDPGGSPSTSGWVNGGGANGGVDNFRIDPHEFSPATAFAFRRVKLAAFDRAGSTYTIGWSFSNPSSMATTLKLVADTDRTGCNGITIASGLDPTLGTYQWTIPGSFNDGEARYVCAQVLSGATVVNQTYSRWPVVREVGYTGLPPRLVADREVLRFGAVNSGGTLTAVTPAQQLVVTQVGSGTVNWSATSDEAWVQVTPGTTSGTDVLTVQVTNPGGVLPATGLLRSSIEIASTDAANSPQYVDVFVDVSAPGTTDPPFGSFDTPSNGATGVAGNIPVTGWALDDVGVDRVEIYRNPVAGLDTPGPNGKVFIGEANFVAGARPDVEAAYEGSMPRAHLAGWGYMLLTNFLPDTVANPDEAVGGNGTFTLYAYAVDEEGTSVLLGSKTITCNNAGATKPFGTIDTPAQGGTASGAGFANFGWALTPQPGTIPTNGSTIQVFVDGAPLGNPTYDLFRSDIATLFPGYANSGGAIGLFSLDTTALSNGVHNIAWSVTDSLGRVDGIGSRFFSVVNGAGDVLQDGAAVEFGDLGQAYGAELGGRVAALLEAPAGGVTPRNVIRERGEPFELRLPARGPGERLAAYSVVDGRLRRLPVGAGFDAAEGRLRWSPGPAHTGDYDLVVVRSLVDAPAEVLPFRVRFVPDGQAAAAE